MNLGVAAVAGMLLCAAPAFADGSGPQSAVSASSIAQLVIGLALVIGMVFACAWLTRRFSLAPGTGNDTLKLITATAVGQRERILLLEVGETWIIVGVAPGRIDALHTMPRAQVAAPAVSRAPAPQGFAVWLRQVMEKRGG